MDIPKEFKLFGTRIEVQFNNERCNDKQVYGESNYGESKIMLSTMQESMTLSEDKILDTFYHEKIHMILDTMNENELSNNEKFVDVFAKLLRQSDVTAIY